MLIYTMIVVASVVFGGVNAFAQPMYEVTVTNVTKAQSFTPILVASHNANANFGMAGSAASAELADLAENGATGGLQAALDANSDVKGTATSAGLLAPGESVTIEVSARRAKYLSLASMIVPSNDTFIWLDSFHAPRRANQPVSTYINAYDSGTEVNDELCASVAGPAAECAGGGGANGMPGNGEGFIHIANGIQGSGELMQSTRDWRGPVAKVTVVKK